LVFLFEFNAVPFASSADVTEFDERNRVDLDAFTSMSWFLSSAVRRHAILIPVNSLYIRISLPWVT
jgi:hypothetical protein